MRFGRAAHRRSRPTPIPTQKRNNYAAAQHDAYNQGFPLVIVVAMKTIALHLIPSTWVASFGKLATVIRAESARALQLHLNNCALYAEAMRRRS
ncbi:hypothetical protein [Paraburkholderia sp.]|uniref:hypothetical protein n=1 Tax=Paraburkholderia sp. TaxID=1926495 RepID=UPI00238F0B07|nr:hypothetical protein [Paraburkholderia sp.]MDE1181999.1 hypothetical protein [Paraburkholderia sp.]